MSSTDRAIEARQLVKTYAVHGRKHGIRALDGLDLHVPQGIIYGLLGPNGAGKSTTVKVLTSLARPDAGSARVEGIDVLAQPGRVRHLIGVVAQRSGADPTATGRENLMLQGRLYGLRGGSARARADELLDHFGLTEAAGRLVKTYSGGMQRRLDVALGLMHRPAVLFLDEPATGLDPEARKGRLYGLRGASVRARADELLDHFGLTDAARRLVKTYSGGMQRRLDVALGLMHRPAVLFLDEPTTGLDPEARTAMWQEIARLAGHEGMTVLLTTHYLEEADRLAGQLAIVDRGQVVATGTPDGLKGQLRGDVVQVELPADAGPTGLVRSVLAGLPEVRDVAIAGRNVSARSDDGAAAVPVVLGALQRAGIHAASVAVARPSLDDVYLRHTGRRYSESETPDANGSHDERELVEAGK